MLRIRISLILLSEILCDCDGFCLKIHRFHNRLMFMWHCCYGMKDTERRINKSAVMPNNGFQTGTIIVFPRALFFYTRLSRQK